VPVRDYRLQIIEFFNVDLAFVYAALAVQPVTANGPRCCPTRFGRVFVVAPRVRDGGARFLSGDVDLVAVQWLTHLFVVGAGFHLLTILVWRCE
jgi:hypothetical protein